MAGFLHDWVTKALTDWKPGTLTNEIEYHKSAEAFLRGKFPEARIEREYRHEGTTADLFVTQKIALFFTHKVFIEAKRNLKQKKDFDRLVGQVAGLGPGKNAIIILLCGETEMRWVDRLKEQYADQLGDRLVEAGMSIVVVK